MTATISDPRDGGKPHELELVSNPNPKTLTYCPPGFCWWRGELREIRETHVTANGTQIELMP